MKRQFKVNYSTKENNVRLGQTIEVAALKNSKILKNKIEIQAFQIRHHMRWMKVYQKPVEWILLFFNLPCFFRIFWDPTSLHLPIFHSSKKCLSPHYLFQLYWIPNVILKPVLQLLHSINSWWIGFRIQWF